MLSLDSQFWVFVGFAAVFKASKQTNGNLDMNFDLELIYFYI